MLVLSRKSNESFIIGKNIRIKVISLDNANVKIGIDAPKDIAVLREELYLNVCQANRRAVKSRNLDESSNFSASDISKALFK